MLYWLVSCCVSGVVVAREKNLMQRPLTFAKHTNNLLFLRWHLVMATWQSWILQREDLRHSSAMYCHLVLVQQCKLSADAPMLCGSLACPFWHPLDMLFWRFPNYWRERNLQAYFNGCWVFLQVAWSGYLWGKGRGLLICRKGAWGLHRPLRFSKWPCLYIQHWGKEVGTGQLYWWFAWAWKVWKRWACNSSWKALVRRESNFWQRLYNLCQDTFKVRRVVFLWGYWWWTLLCLEDAQISNLQGQTSWG